METHRRWLCKSCAREWIEPTAYFLNSAPVSISGNPKGLNCPICGGPDIELVEYKPELPGLDIPRDNKKVIPTEMVRLGPNNIIHIKANPNLIKSEDVVIPELVEQDSIYDLSDMD